MTEALPDLDRCEHWAFVCEASDCRYRGAPAVRDALARAVHEGGHANVAVVRTGCLSLCGAGPAVVAYPSGDVHLQVQPADAPEMALQLAAGAPLKRRAVRAPQWYRDRIASQFSYAIRLLKQRYRRAQTPPTGAPAR
jgi:(2Fe-2S) ferredoxin